MPESLVEKLSVRKCITVNENDNLKLVITFLAVGQKLSITSHKFKKKNCWDSIRKGYH